MTGSSDELVDNPQHSPRTKGIIQHFQRQVKLHTDGLDEDLRVSNERLGQLEMTQIDTNGKLATLQASVGATNTTLVEILQRLNAMGAPPPAAPDAAPAAPAGNAATNQHAHNADLSSVVDDNEDYSVETEIDEHHRLHRRNHRGMGPLRPRNNDTSLGKIKFTMPPFNGKYDPDAYITWELSVDQKFACHEFPRDKRVRAATSEFTDFASVWWSEYCRTNVTPPNWDALKRIMRARFVPSYYARDLLQKL